MITIPIVMAKLAGLKLLLSNELEDQRAFYFDYAIVRERYSLYSLQVSYLRGLLPAEFGDFPVRQEPKSSGTGDFQGRGYVERPYLKLLLQDIDYILEVRANSRIGEAIVQPNPRRVFISHGTSEDWRTVQDHIERDLQIPTLELAQQPNRGRTVLQKLTEESDKCSYAVVVMTGDDQIQGDSTRARQNVMHEIGFFQGKFGLPNVCLLYEEETDIPSNIHGLVYIPFPKGLVSATFGALGRELKTAFQV
jgi:predicted nucleotide-binding protein